MIAEVTSSEVPKYNHKNVQPIDELILQKFYFWISCNAENLSLQLPSSFGPILNVTPFLGNRALVKIVIFVPLPL